MEQIRKLTNQRHNWGSVEVESVSHWLCSTASGSVAVGQVMLYQAFSVYTGGGHAAELPFDSVTEINALK